MRLKWINHDCRGRLGITPRPDGAERLAEQMQTWSHAGVTRVVSMLQEDEAEKLGLAREGEECAAHGMVFTNFPVLDHHAPDDLDAIRPLVTEISAALDAGEKVAIHCRAALGRAPLVACCVMIARGVHVDEAFLAVGHARGATIPETEVQVEFVRAFAADVKTRPLERTLAA